MKCRELAVVVRDPRIHHERRTVKIIPLRDVVSITEVKCTPDGRTAYCREPLKLFVLTGNWLARVSVWCVKHDLEVVNNVRLTLPKGSTQ